MQTINLFEKEKLEFQAWGHGKAYKGASLEIAKDWQSEKLGFHLQTLDPGKFSCPYHCHAKEEEVFLVIEGQAICRSHGEFKEIKKGDLIFFKTGVAHQFYNHTPEAFVFLALSNKDDKDVCVYPDSEKRLDYGKQSLTQRGVPTSDYWKDEDNPAAFWPKDFGMPNKGKPGGDERLS